MCCFRQTCIKTFIILLLVSDLYGGGNIYSYVVFKTQENELNKIYLNFLNPKKITFIYKKPIIINNTKNPYTFFSNIDITKKPSVNLGMEIDLNSLNSKSVNYVFHDYNSTIINQNTLYKIYYNNLLALNYRKNRFLKTIKDIFLFYSKYIPKYKFAAQKYNIQYSLSKNKSLYILKPFYINLNSLTQYIQKARKNFFNTVIQNNTIQTLKAKLKLYITKDNKDEYASASLNLKFPLKKDNSMKIAKLNLLNSFNSKTYKIYSLAESVNKTYLQYKQSLTDISFNIKSIKYDLLKIKYGLNTNLDQLASKYVKIYDLFYALNDLSYKNQTQYLQLFTLLKELNEY